MHSARGAVAAVAAAVELLLTICLSLLLRSLFVSIHMLSLQQYISGGVSANLRSDGRGRLGFRPYRVLLGVVPHANGSARIQLEQTDVMCAVNLAMVTPDWSEGKKNANRGIVQCSVDSAPSATTDMDDRAIQAINTQLSA